MDAAHTDPTTAVPPAAPPLELTERAARRIVKIAAGEAPGSALRISVSGGGCSGFQYEFGFTTERNEDDFVVERDGATLLVDSMSLEYMAGSKVDFVDSLIGQSFQVINPQATASCGCGTSFSI